MGSFLLFVILIVVFITLFILSAGISILRALFNFFSGNKQSSSSQQQGRSPFHDDKDERHDPKDGGEKFFSKDEGEYVDFVEYKDDESKKQQ